MFLSTYLADLHLVLPAMHVSVLDAGILIMVQQVDDVLTDDVLVDYSMSFLSLSI